MNNKKFSLYLLLILLLAAGVRILGLENRGLYFPDETRYYKYAAGGCEILQTDGLKSALKFAGNTFTAKPGHTTLGIIWMIFFGVNPCSVLMMNVFFGVLTVFLIWMMARTFYTGGAALIAALILSLSTLHIYYSRSFMSHIDQIFFILLAFYLYALPLIIPDFSRRLCRQENAIMLRFISGFLLGIAFTIHPTTTIYIAAFFIYELILLFADMSRRFRNKVVTSIIFFVAITIAPLFFLFLNKSYLSRLLWLVNEARLLVIQKKSEPVPFMLSRVIPVYEGAIFGLLVIFASIYFIYRIAKHKRPIDLLSLLQSLGIFLYWEFFSVHERFSRQVLITIPFFSIGIGVFIDSIKLKNIRTTNIIKAILIIAIIISSSYSAGAMLASTKNYYGELEAFIRSQGDKVKIITPSEYFAGTKDVLMPNLKIDITWLNEKEEIIRAVDGGGFDLLVIYPSDWLSRPEFRLAIEPVFTIKEPQNSYFAEFYEGICFNNRFDLLSYRTNPLSYSIAVYKINDLLRNELRKKH